MEKCTRYANTTSHLTSRFLSRRSGQAAADPKHLAPVQGATHRSALAAGHVQSSSGPTPCLSPTRGVFPRGRGAGRLPAERPWRQAEAGESDGCPGRGPHGAEKGHPRRTLGRRCEPGRCARRRSHLAPHTRESEGRAGSALPAGRRPRPAQEGHVPGDRRDSMVCAGRAPHDPRAANPGAATCHRDGRGGG